MSIPQYTRRDALGVATYILPTLLPTSNSKPICIIGASGPTGTECVKLLAKEKQKVRAVSRNWIKDTDLEDLSAVDRSYIQDLNIDIKNFNVIDNIVKDTSSVIFLANAKKFNRYSQLIDSETQKYEDIDTSALTNVVNACIKYKIPRLVYVSASCRSCLLDNYAEFDKMSAIKCENCVSKQNGEKTIRRFYKKAPVDVDYSIIRIGVLLQNINQDKNVSDLEINQDFSKSGIISKQDLAKLCINTANNPYTKRTTFEAYYRETTQPFDIDESLTKCTQLGHTIEQCFFGEEFKDKKPSSLEEVRNTKIRGSIFTTGFEFTGNNWNELFQNLRRDT
jgi:nucleoside-diphosphate-sugar epimerase